MKPPFSPTAASSWEILRLEAYEYHRHDVPLGKRTVDLDQGRPLAKEHCFKGGSKWEVNYEYAYE